jgi:ribosomal protein L18
MLPGHTVVAASSNEKNGVNGGNIAGAKAVGKLVAERAKGQRD